MIDVGATVYYIDKVNNGDGGSVVRLDVVIREVEVLAAGQQAATIRIVRPGWFEGWSTIETVPLSALYLDLNGALADAAESLRNWVALLPRYNYGNIKTEQGCTRYTS